MADVRRSTHPLRPRDATASSHACQRPAQHDNAPCIYVSLPVPKKQSRYSVKLSLSGTGHAIEAEAAGMLIQIAEIIRSTQPVSAGHIANRAVFKGFAYEEPRIDRCARLSDHFVKTQHSIAWSRFLRCRTRSCYGSRGISWTDGHSCAGPMPVSREQHKRRRVFVQASEAVVLCGTEP